MENGDRIVVVAVVFFLCLLATIVIGVPMLVARSEKANKDTASQHVTIDLDQNIKHYRYKNHEYLVFMCNRNTVVLHDPDCLCHRKD